MAAILEITPVGGTPYEFFVENTAMIGRAAGNNVVFRGSSLVSRQHAILRRHDGESYQIMDLGSLNGTYVDGQRVVMPVTLKDGARVTIGGNDLVFRPVSLPVALELDEATISSVTSRGAVVSRQAAILVCDIRGFSGYSESLPGEMLARVLGGWFREAGELIQSAGGVVDKFIGDAVLAYWIDGVEAAASCQKALGVAHGLLEAAERLSWPLSGRPFRIGVALHYGPVTQSNIGLVAQRDATIIGDAVNTAFRLEGVMKERGMKVVMSSELLECVECSSGFVDCGETELKGKTRPVRIFGLPSAVA